MRLIKPSYQILEDPSNLKDLYIHIAGKARVCYKSEELSTDESDRKVVKNCITNGHHSVLEHEKVSVKVICDRGVTHEIVRHRLASYSQESTRFCNYGKSGQVVFIIPPWVNIPEGEYPSGSMFAADNHIDQYWFNAMDYAESFYLTLLEKGWQPQQARSVLPNSLKTEIVITMNLREWRHFFNLRALGASGKPHPQMLELTIPMLTDFKRLIPIIFDDLQV